MNLDALRSLQEQASPGPWRTKQFDVWGGDGAWFGILHATCQLDMGDGSPNPSLDEQLDGRKATAKLAAISVNHLLPISEALETTQCWSWGDGDCADLSPDDPCDRCKALKNLQEALDG